MPLRVFFAQPIDGLEREHIRNRVELLERTLSPIGIDLVTPYLADINESASRPTTQLEAKDIVARDYHLLSTCDVLIADLSDEQRQAVGIIFEMAYAHRNKIPIVVFTGESSLGDRVWIKAITDRICSTISEIPGHIMNL